MKRAIVLSGGGAQGAYQIGVWKALRKLNINYDIVTGTSVGALNGALMAQDTYYKALHVWKNINYIDVFNTNINQVYQDKNNIKKYLDIILKGGVETSALENVISNAIEPNKLLASHIQYGLAVTKWPSLKPLYLTTQDLDDQKLHDYLMASCAIYPLFKKKKVNEQTLIDGGFYDNLPINLAIDLGATEIIAINLNAFGRIRKVKNKAIPITYISPKNNLGDFLAFEKDPIKRAIHLGYNDALKSFNHYDGNLYTFRKDTLLKNHKYYYKHFEVLLNNIIKDNKALKKLIKYKSLNDFNNIIEFLGETLDINDEKIYRADYFNHLIIHRINKVNYDTNITLNELKKLVDGKQIITHFLYHLNQPLDEANLKHINILSVLSPVHFLAALYVKTLKEQNIIFKYSEVLTWSSSNASLNK